MIVTRGLGRGDPTTIVAFGLGRRSAVSETAFHAPRTFALIVFALRLAAIATAQTQAHLRGEAMTVMIETPATGAIQTQVSMSASVAPSTSDGMVTDARFDATVSECCNTAELVAVEYDAILSAAATRAIVDDSEDDAEVN